MTEASRWLSVPDPAEVGHWRRQALGTMVELLLHPCAEVGTAQLILDDSLAELDRCASRFREDSELSRVNRGAGRPQRLSPLLAELLAVALDAARSTGGLTDPTLGRPLIDAGYAGDFAQIPESEATPYYGTASGWGWQGVRLLRDVVEVPAGVLLDLGATAKAWAADRAAEEVAARLNCSVLVSLGGDLATAGRPPPGGWVVRVADDHKDPSGPGQNVRLDGPALATSSTTQRSWIKAGRVMNHLIDPQTGAPAVGPWRTVSVAASSCVAANTASTAAILAGAHAPAWLRRRAVAARLVSQDDQVLHLGGWPSEGDDLPSWQPSLTAEPDAD